MKIGCVHCSDVNKCPDAFTEVSQFCGAYDNNEVKIFEEGIINGSSRTETDDKEQ